MNAMNPKSKLLVKYEENVIEMNTTFAKMMQNPMSGEYELLQKTRQDFPTFAVRKRQIKTNPKKDTYKGLTYEYMRNYIADHEAKDVVEKELAAFDEMLLVSRCHRASLRYPTVKKWFLAKYPEVVKFVILEEDKKEDEANGELNPDEAKSQNVIPMQPDTQFDNASGF